MTLIVDGAIRAERIGVGVIRSEDLAPWLREPVLTTACKRRWVGTCCRTCARGRGRRESREYRFIKRLTRRTERHEARRALRDY